MLIGVPQETFPGERRVALTPKVLPLLKKAGIDVLTERGAGEAAGFSDASYEQAGAALGSRDEVFARAAVLAQVRSGGANPHAQADTVRIRSGQVMVGMADPLTRAELLPQVVERGPTLFALELLPRITRAQTMDVLSSQATIAGYKAVLLAADALPKMMPMLTPAAGTLAAARVLVIGAGVAGLQAIATARRLGSVVSGYDVRGAVKEQVESLGARFVVLDLPAQSAEGAGGYAKAMDEAFYARQRELLTQVIRDQDVVITTAAVPGAKAPILVTAAMVQAMAPGSVVVDLAAERGGNCELTRPGETIQERGVRVMGPLNVPSTVPNHASQMYARNMTAFLTHLIRKGELVIDTSDEITRETLVGQEGRIVHPRVQQVYGLTTPAAAGA
jgi:NAD(P) transhydrogenase subunit alpha